MANEKTGFDPTEVAAASKRLHMSAMSEMGIEHGSLQEKIFLGLGVGGEGGEVADAIKKLWRDGESPETLRQIRLEMADVYLYLDHLCDAMDVQPMDCIIEKLNILFFERKPAWAQEALEWIEAQKEKQNDS